MLKLLKGKRLVFVGDSLNRNMWESLVCILKNSVKNPKNVYEAHGKRHFRTEASYSFVFKVRYVPIHTIFSLRVHNLMFNQLNLLPFWCSSRIMVVPLSSLQPHSWFNHGMSKTRTELPMKLFDLILWLKNLNDLRALMYQFIIPVIGGHMKRHRKGA